MRKIFFLLGLLGSLSTVAYTPEKAGFSIDINGEINPYKIFSTFVMPGESIHIQSSTPVILESLDMKIHKNQETSWTIEAAKSSGIYKVSVHAGEGESMALNVLVLTPLSQMKGEYLNEYRIGNYPSKPLKGNPIYNMPAGLFEVNETNLNLKLTPHFTLQQFLCKQEGDFPKYLLIRERLLLKLEYLLEKVNEKGHEVNTFGFISGYRTPYYNALIKNVPYSRHVYGGAADIYIDQDNDGSMDDLNQDGTINEHDVQIFYKIVDSEYEKASYSKYKGGLGFYRKNGRHNGFIHVDVRGWKARW